MDHENKPTEARPAQSQNLFAAPAPIDDQPKVRSSGHSQTGIFVRAILIVPVTLLAFFGPIFGFAWLRENEFWAFNTTFAMLMAIGLALAVFTIMLLDILRVSKRKPKPEKMINHEFPD